MVDTYTQIDRSSITLVVDVVVVVAVLLWLLFVVMARIVLERMELFVLLYVVQSSNTPQVTAVGRIL